MRNIKAAILWGVMFRIESNLAEVALRLQMNIRKAETNMSRYLLEAAADGMTAVAHRIQQQGRNTAGQVMRTKSPRSAGAYSKAYAQYRRLKGRQTEKVDFTMEGDLMRNYNIIRSTAREVVVGFLDVGMAEIAGYLEAYFGSVWYLSEAEKKLILNKLAQQSTKDLTG